MENVRCAEYLSVFVEVCRLGSFSAAARRRSVTHSSIVRQIDALEADLGVPLLTPFYPGVGTNRCWSIDIAAGATGPGRSGRFAGRGSGAHRRSTRDAAYCRSSDMRQAL